ncbi:hypothetical protein BaRGS_00037834 [Batillaria attramentaria]|uniref:Protein tweety homolog n=1 Tax=Batillaria attramentaria TaxID=370345 RepID=A0ABD0J8B0_9CAEN
MAFATPSLEYHKIWMADFFHKFPHIDLSFEKTNSTFNPESRTYREALGFWAGLPVVWCVLLWLAFLIFFCLRCCRKSERKQAKTACSRICAGLFLFMGCGALGVAFYGNESVHTGVDSFVDAVKSTNATVENSLGVLDVLDSIATNIKTKDVPSLLQAVDTIANVTARTKIRDSIAPIETNLDEAKNDIISVRKNATQVDTEHVVHYTQMVEYYRAATLSVIFMLFIWLATGVYLALSVAGGDLCVDPDSFVVSRVQGTIEKKILLDYIDCSGKTTQPHLLEDIIDAQQSVSQAITALNATVNISAPFSNKKLAGRLGELRQDLKSAFGNLSALASLVGNCDTIHGETGVGLLVLVTALLGLCSTLVVLCSSLAWPYMGRRRHRRRADYTPVDDTDPFLPNPPPYEQDYGSMRRANVANAAGDTQPVDYPRLNQDRRLMNDLPLGESPPPAYQAGNYMQQYYNLAPRPSSIQQSLSDA